MAGLISQAEDPSVATAAVPSETAPADPADDEGGEAPAGDEQEWYDAVQKAATHILFKDDKASGAVVSMLNPDKPALSAGSAAAEVMLIVDRGMDGDVPEDVILPASQEILGHVLDIAVAAKILERSEQVDAEAAQAMVARLAEEYGIDEQDFQQAQAKAGPAFGPMTAEKSQTVT